MWSKYTIYTDIIEYETPFYLYHSFFHKSDRYEWLKWFCSNNVKNDKE